LRGGGDPQRRRPDISRARSLLGWEPKISLDEGIRKIIPYFKQQLGIL
jgi:nucleoside-diphosphate-sugar epimerase